MNKPPVKPGIVPGGWSTIVYSDHLIGGSIWASHDEDFYLAETNHVGYAFHHGYWGLIDVWRRPKTEWWLSRHIFSPVWLKTRSVNFAPGQQTIRLRVENRFSFTDFNELDFTWQLGKHKGKLHPKLAPGADGELEIPTPRESTNGEKVFISISTHDKRVIEECSVQLGSERSASLQRPKAGA